MTAHRGSVLTLAAAAVILAACGWWLPRLGLYVLAVLLAAWLAAQLGAEHGRSQAWRQQAGLVRTLHKTARRLPRGQALDDPVSGACLRVDRTGAFMTLAVISAPAGAAAKSPPCTTPTRRPGPGGRPARRSVSMTAPA